jgi:hypothetical protein
MKAFVTTLFVSLTLMTFGQNPADVLNETPRHIVDKAVAKWKEKNATLTASANQASFSAGTVMAAEFAFADETLDRIESIDRGLWNETTTWDCACIPTAENNVTVHHEVTLSADASVGSLLLDNGGRLLANEPATLTFMGNLTSVETQPGSSNISLNVDNAGAAQMLDATMAISNLTVANRATLEVYGSIKAFGHIEVNDATLAVDADATLTLGEDDMGRATILRKNGGNVIGKLTREIFLAAAPNRDMSLVEQRITTGLEGVTVADFVGDIPTWGFDGADDPSGFSSIGYWSAAATWNYAAVGDINDTLPVFEGIYLALDATESYTLTFSGTLPANDVTMDIPQTAFNVLVGNATNANANLNAIDAQFGDNNTSFRCWNTRTLQFDQYISGLSTNDLSATLQPNTTCEFAPSGVTELTMVLNEGLPKGTQTASPADVDGTIVLSAANATGFKDESVVAFREGTATQFLNTEDALNSASLYSACDLSFRDAAGNRSAISQLNFADETQTQLDVVLAANRPIDGTYTIVVEEMTWNEGCAFITLDGDSVAMPLEEGFLTTVELDGNSNNTQTIGTITLVPATRTEVSSPGCEGEGETYITVLPSGDGPWDIALSDAMGNPVAGTAQGAGIKFDDLASGTYTYAVLNNGNFTCGAQTGQHTVVRPTDLELEATVQNDCGEGGSVQANVTNATSDVTYTWNHGQTGAELTQLAGGKYTVIAQDEAGCADTATVMVVRAPQVQVASTSGLCDGSTEMRIDIDSNSDTALWNIKLNDAMGNAQGTALNVTAPFSFNVAAADTYNVEVMPLNGLGCGIQTYEAVVTPASNLAVTANATQMTCGDVDAGAIELTITGAYGDAQVAWEHGAEGATLTELAGGDYRAVVTDDNGCTQDVEVSLNESPTVIADFTAPTTGLTADAGNDGFTVMFTNTSEGNFTEQTWTFVHVGEESQNFHEAFTFEAAGTYDVMLEVRNDQCVDIVRKRVVVEGNATGSNEETLEDMVSGVEEEIVFNTNNPVMTSEGWMIDLGTEGEGMTMMAYDLTGRQLCSANAANGGGQIFIENNQWPSVVLLRLVHEPTNTMRTWKMVR